MLSSVVTRNTYYCVHKHPRLLVVLCRIQLYRLVGRALDSTCVGVYLREQDLVLCSELIS